MLTSLLALAIAAPCEGPLVVTLALDDTLPAAVRREVFAEIQSAVRELGGVLCAPEGVAAPVARLDVHLRADHLVELLIDNATTSRAVVRTLSLAGVPADAQSLVVSQLLVDALRASWTAIRRAASTAQPKPPEPPPPPGPPPPLEPSATPLPPEPPALPPPPITPPASPSLTVASRAWTGEVRVHATFYGGGVEAIGPVVGVLHALPWDLHAGLRLGYGAILPTDAGVGTVSGHHLWLAPVVLYRFELSAETLGLDIGAHLRAGWAELGGTGDSGTTTRESIAVFDLGGELTLVWQVAAPFRLSLGLEAGGVLRALEALDAAGEAIVAYAGPYLAPHLGVAAVW